jgi:1,6-anhydro-N-acetylmuramate kinase
MTKVVSVHQLGFNPDYLEAVCYALMGVLAIKGLPVGLPHITGAGRKTVAGRVILT